MRPIFSVQNYNAYSFEVGLIAVDHILGPPSDYFFACAPYIGCFTPYDSPEDVTQCVYDQLINRTYPNQYLDAIDACRSYGLNHVSYGDLSGVPIPEWKMWHRSTLIGSTKQEKVFSCIMVLEPNKISNRIDVT